jgi:ribonuclease R
MHKKKFLQGTIKRHPDGFGFFIPDSPDQPDVYIPRHCMLGVMSNDKVMAEIKPEPGGNRFRGEIIRIVARGTKKIVGTFVILNPQSGLIKDDSKGWGTDLKVSISDALGANTGDLVSAEITSYPDGEGAEFRGKIISVIGSSLDPLTDVKRVLLNNHIPHEFSSDTLKESSRFDEHVNEKDFQGRKDLRKFNFVTIDGATAKDFDDAIFVQTTATGFHLWVAIADVSHYVRPGTAIDRDAYERGTSVYFPNFVVPMLPEVLSNGLCSLIPHVPRLALVSEMKFDFAGEMKSSAFYEAVIESKARVTYGEAQEVVDGAEVTKLIHVAKDIKCASDLAKILMAKRFQEGSLDLEIPEMQMVLDGSGNPVDLIKSERLFAHRLIEEMMLAANVAVAKYFEDKDVPAIYRIHESPNEEMIQILEKYLTTFGGRINISGGKLQKKLTKALQQFDGKPESQVLNILTLRSMSQAKYSHNNLGHFGLGFDFYTHFTSPIRRYPDLIVHRVLKSLIIPGAGYRAISEDELATSGAMLSSCEQRAVKAERQFQAIKKARFMQKHLGEEFDGTISSVTKFGVFVLLRAFEVDGLIRMENLGNERFDFDEENLWLVAQRSGFKYAIGDVVKIRVVNADSDAGQVDFELADQPARPLGHRTGKEMPKVFGKPREGRRDFKKSSPGDNRKRDNQKRDGRKNSDQDGKTKQASRPRNAESEPQQSRPQRPGRLEIKSSHRGLKSESKDGPSKIGKKTGKSFFKKFRSNKKKSGPKVAGPRK